MKLQPGLPIKTLCSVVFSFGLCTTTLAQLTTPAETAACWYNIMLGEDMDILVGLDPAANQALMFQKPNEDAEILMDESYKLIQTMLGELAEIDLLDKNALDGKITYSRLGYPISTLKKAAKSGAFDQYVRIEISVTGTKLSTKSSGVTQQVNDQGTEGTVTNTAATVYPQVDVKMVFANGEGETVSKVEGMYRHTERVAFSENSYSMGSWTYPKNRSGEVIPFYQYLQLAIENLVQNLGPN